MASRHGSTCAGVNTYTLFSGPAGDHKVRVTRRTGAQVGPTRILDIRAKGAP